MSNVSGIQDRVIIAVDDDDALHAIRIYTGLEVYRSGESYAIDRFEDSSDPVANDVGELLLSVYGKRRFKDLLALYSIVLDMYFEKAQPDSPPV